ncbi:unnamed protein product [Rhizophagus irregularis]|nr:unnamed protein product [Rhizophagus irregularis]
MRRDELYSLFINVYNLGIDSIFDYQLSGKEVKYHRTAMILYYSDIQDHVSLNKLVGILPIKFDIIM